MKYIQQHAAQRAVPTLHRCPFEDFQDQIERRVEKRLLFDPLTTPIKVTGEHAFVPPDFSSGDQRGPCPGLNALANHGYIAHNGITTFVEVTAAINQVFGMGIDLATILATMGTVWAGNPLSIDAGFSIGGPTSANHDIFGDIFGLLGTPQGLIGSHNLIESDSSNTRDDLYVTGDNYKLHMEKFMTWYNMTSGDYSMDDMAKRAKIRFDETIASNPYFYYGPVTGLVSRNAGYLFPARMFRNYSSENVEGVLTKDIIKNFFAIYGDEGSFEYKQGWETIPENWYRTPVEYGLVPLNLDLIDWITKYPELASIGGNTGTVNSFTGVDLGNFTNGLITVDTLLKNNNLLCFAFQIVKFASPNILSGFFSTIDVPLEMVTKALAVPLLSLDCPAWDDLNRGGEPIWEKLQELFPGAAKSGFAL
ncbi:putative oxidase [Glonium stellatum]|uniref:Putative oxidase n=1 Tax=Glonium stellatum TaxID=574774 RepID=A0A8E2F1Y9_9PEZI|nr:putative oxidase [Glonium stellatum]